MYASLAILLSLTGAVYQLEINASYTTSFPCSDGSYAFISGANLTLQYDYGLRHTQVQSFHLYELTAGRHMFDYERVTGQAFIKTNRLKSYEWTPTGIKLTFTEINKKLDLGKYGGEVATDREYKQEMIEVKEIFDPPTEIKMSAPGGLQTIELKKGFGEYVLNTFAESHSAIPCSSVIIIWMSPTKGNLLSCQAEDIRNDTVCPFTLKESEMTAGCTTLEVYAQQYGVMSQKTVYYICYVLKEDTGSADDCSTNVIVGLVIGNLLLAVIIVMVVVVRLKKKDQNKKTQQGEVDGSVSSVFVDRLDGILPSKTNFGAAFSINQRSVMPDATAMHMRKQDFDEWNIKGKSMQRFNGTEERLVRHRAVDEYRFE